MSLVTDDPGSLYGAAYYQSHLGPVPYARNAHWLQFFDMIAARLVAELEPHSVLDAGCAWGFLVESFRDRRVEAWGVDVSPFAISQVRADMRPYCRLGSLTEPIADRYDLITCIEVLEHLSPSDARLAVERLTAATDTLLFSSTPSDFEEPTHRNVQPIISWLKLFAEHGFAPDILFDAAFVASHAFLLRRCEKVTPEEILILFSEKLQMQSELTGRDIQLARLKRDLDAATVGELRRLQVEVESSRQEIARIYSSPAWNLISQYRRWLKSQQLRRTLIWRIYEPGARWALRLLAGLSARGDISNDSPVLAKPDDSRQYRDWYSRVEPSETQLALQRDIAVQLSYRPLISVLVPVFRVPLAVVRAMIESIVTQTYDHWELCVVHADPEDTAVRAYLANICRQEPRVKLSLLSQNYGISGNSNQALSLATGEFLALLDHDDTLAPFALFEVARALNGDPKLDFIYSDKDQIEEHGLLRVRPLFKPDWSPDFLLSANYLTHLNVMRTERVRAIAGWRPQTDGAQDWDLFLRVITSHSRIHHIPMVLYHWRRVETSVALRGLAAKPYAEEAQLLTLRDHLARVKSSADMELTGDGLFKLRWTDGTRKPASIIIVQQSGLRDTILFAKRVLAQTANDVLELVIASEETASTGDPRIRLIPVGSSQSLATRLNLAANASRGEALIFLDENVTARDGSWIRELTGPLESADIGAVGVKLVDAQSDLIRHAGLIFDDNGRLESIFAGEPDGFCGVFGPVFWYRNWLAVSGACFSVTRENFLAVGGFAEHPDYPRLDVDFCLRVRFHNRGRILYNPFARLSQSKTAALEQVVDPGMSQAGAEFIRLCFPNGDPYFNPNLICNDGRVDLNYPSLNSVEVNNPFSLEARALASEFDVSAPMVAASKQACAQPAQRKLDSITWFVPEFSNPFYGGIHTILRFADYFRSRHGAQSTFVVLGNGRAESLKARIAEAFPDLASASAVTIIAKLSQAGALQPSDAAVATYWKTAYPVLAFNQTRRKFYFLQDYEPWFYPAGSTSAFAESTYQFGFLGICNTVALLGKYREQGGEGEYFNPSVDSSIFHANGRKSDSSQPYVVLFYARPAHPRNCFELVSAAMTILKRRLGNRVRIVAAGSEWAAASYGLDGIVENLGMLEYQLTGALYRTCDAGVTMMMTAHPSYLPLELMACGALVVSNRNSRTAWFLKDRVNCLLAENRPSAIADAVEEGLMNRALRKTIIQRSAETLSKEYSQWDVQAEKIYKYMLDQC